MPSRLRGEETSLNPLGMVEGLMGAMNHAADIHGGADEARAPPAPAHPSTNGP
jgi:hypothetical protein